MINLHHLRECKLIDTYQQEGCSICPLQTFIGILKQPSNTMKLFVTGLHLFFNFLNLGIHLCCDGFNQLQFALLYEVNQCITLCYNTGLKFQTIFLIQRKA